MAYLIYTAAHIASKKKLQARFFVLTERKYQKKWANNSKGIINNLSIILFSYWLFIYRSVKDNYFLNEIKCENPFTMLKEEHLVHVFQIFLHFHVCEFSYSYWSDAMRCKFAAYFQNTFSQEHLRVAATGCRKQNEGNNSRKQAMVYKCRVVDCRSN